MPYQPLVLCRADENDHDAIVGLIEAAAQWLRETKDTTQWSQPWRSEEDRSNRIRRDLIAGEDLAAAGQRHRHGHDHRRS